MRRVYVLNILKWDDTRGETRSLIGGGGGVYSYIPVLPDKFLLKSEIDNTNIHSPPPPPINALVSPLDDRIRERMSLTWTLESARPKKYITNKNCI